MKRELIELKVGIVSFLALICGIALLLVVEDTNLLQKSYSINVGFADAAMLLEGSNVNMSGVKIGRVNGLYINLKPSQEYKVIANLEINTEYDIPMTSNFTIGSSGLFGTNYVKIDPPVEILEGELQYISRNSEKVFLGTQPESFQDLVVQGKSALEKVESILGHVESVVGDGSTKASLKKMVKNLEASTGQVDLFLTDLREEFQSISVDVLSITSNLNEILIANRSSVKRSIKNLEYLSQDMREISNHNKNKIDNIISRIDEITLSVEDNGGLKNSMRKIRGNFERLGENMEAVSQKAREIIENPQLEEKIHEAIGSATTAADALTDIKRDLYSTNTTFTSQVLYSAKNDHYESNFYLDTEFKNKYLLKMGIENSETDSGLSLFQGGMKTPDLTLRAGILEDKFGLGIEKDIMDNQVTVGLESYDLNDPAYRAFTQYHWREGSSLMMRIDKINKSKERDVMVGVSHRF
tara:strand:+ start:1004 stop:2410 length:1407 start_codon:yes stop_codon:yes gene_type:complete